MKFRFYLGGVDYIFESSRTIAVPAKAANVSFNITITDDHILEANESFFLYIKSMPGNIVKYIPSEAQVIILNDDG